MKKLNIYYQCDNNWAYMLGVSITSLLINASTEIQYDIYILNPDISDENKSKIEKLLEMYADIHCAIIYLDSQYCDETIAEWNLPTHRGRYITYYKLLIDHYFQNTDVETIIEIGPDTLVLGTLEDLIDFDFGGNPIAMNWSEKLYQRHFKRTDKYCIAEMVFFNLKEWRARNCEDRIVSHLKKYGDIYGSKDEGLLNSVFQHEIAQLPLEYNLYGITYYFEKKNKLRFNNAPIMTKDAVEYAYEHPQIIHIPATFLYRPHEQGTLHPLKEMWWEYCEKSPWKGMTPLPILVPLGAKEKFLRFMYTHLPKSMAERFFILARQGYGYLCTYLYPYKEDYGQNTKQIYTKNEKVVERGE